ncbi:MAG: NAD-binding protein [Thermodesulfobacteriota bacterium]
MKRFAVIGLGNFGFFVAKALFEDGNEVIAVDSDRNRIQAIEPYCSEAIVMNATEKEQLKSLGLEVMNAVIVSTGTQISISILICLHLHEIGVKKILAKAMASGKAVPGSGAVFVIESAMAFGPVSGRISLLTAAVFSAVVPAVFFIARK